MQNEKIIEQKKIDKTEDIIGVLYYEQMDSDDQYAISSSLEKSYFDKIRKALAIADELYPAKVLTDDQMKYLFNSVGLELNENTFSITIKLLVASGDISSTEELIYLKRKFE